jgi:hypothetical protein
MPTLIFLKKYDESVSYFKRLEKLERIRHTKGPATPPLDNLKPVFNFKAKSSQFIPIFSVSIMRKQQKTADFKTIARFNNRRSFNLERIFLAFHCFFEEINAIIIQQKKLKTARIAPRNAE